MKVLGNGNAGHAELCRTAEVRFRIFDRIKAPAGMGVKIVG
jgi:hypothetical protein